MPLLEEVLHTGNTRQLLMKQLIDASGSILDAYDSSSAIAIKASSQGVTRLHSYRENEPVLCFRCGKHATLVEILDRELCIACMQAVHDASAYAIAAIKYHIK